MHPPTQHPHLTLYLVMPLLVYHAHQLHICGHSLAPVTLCPNWLNVLVRKLCQRTARCQYYYKPRGWQPGRPGRMSLDILQIPTIDVSVLEYMQYFKYMRIYRLL